MFIDWFTVVAQAVNFLILVWLLKRFLYKPILRAIDEREKRVAGQLREAGAKTSEAERERAEFQRKNEEFARQRDGLLGAAAAEAKAERQRLMDEARSESEALRARFREAMQAERAALGRAVGDRARSEVFAIARQALSDLGSASLEDRVGEVFVRRLRELPPGDQAKLAAFLQQTGRPALVRTAFDLPPGRRAAIESAVQEVLGAQTRVQFETSPALVSGVELVTNGHKVAWSIADYLASLEKSVGDVLEANHDIDH